MELDKYLSGALIEVLDALCGVLDEGAVGDYAAGSPRSGHDARCSEVYVEYRLLSTVVGLDCD
jgi:hypothetical protein